MKTASFVPGLAVLLAACVAVDRPALTPPAPPAPSPSAVIPPPPPAPPHSGKVTTDTPHTTAGGTMFTVPAGWTVASEEAITRLTGPEPDLVFAIVEVSAKTGDEAVAAAWKSVHPGFARPVHLALEKPGRNGWEEAHHYQYETSPNEKLLVIANARRAGGTWVVLTIESSQAAIEKRISSLDLVVQSLRPKGYAKESFAGRTPHELDAGRVKELVDFVEEARGALGIPGVALSLVQNGKVLFEGGLGVRELGKPAKVDADTLFLIASNTKALSTLLLAKEIDDGKFTWETPVTQVYPAFKLGDEATTRQVLMKHLVCACTGLPRQDLEWVFQFKDATPASELALLGTFQPTTKFGETFQYSNLMAAAAGYIAGHVAHPNMELGAAYDRAMKERLLTPMGMKTTTFDFARAVAGDHASPHARNLAGDMRVAKTDMNFAIVPLRPAGGAWSSAKDLTKYVQMELAKGLLPSGERLVSENALLARRAPQVTTGEHATYGMGLEVDTEWGIPVVHHGGDLVGYHSDMVWLPEQGMAAVIMTNSDDGWALRRPFLRKMLEVAFDGRPEARDDVLARAKQIQANVAKDREQLALPASADAVARLARHYRNDALGDVNVTTREGACVLDFGEWKSAVASRKNEDGTTSLFTVDPGAAGIELVIGEKDGKRVLVTRDAQHEYAFVEVR